MTLSIDLEIAATKLIALTEEMCLSLQRTSRSLYVKETADFACAIAGQDGSFVAYPNAIGVSGFVGLNVLTAVQEVTAREPLRPGDVIITNDPYATGGLSTHLPDIQMIAPYFHGDQIVAYGWAFIHCSDIGGRVPSSVSPFNTNIFAEGLQIPPVKIARQKEIVPDMMALLHRNTRTPEANDGDFQAMLGALATGRQRVADLVDSAGVDTFLASCEYVVTQTAARARQVLRSLDGGSCRSIDFLDSDGVSPVPVRIAITATLVDGELTVDFTGTDPQVASAFNIASFGTVHAWLTTRILALLLTLDPSMPLNIGLLRPVRVIAPAGTVVHARRPAPVGVRHATASRVNDVLSAALIQLAPDVLPAASSGVVVPVVVSEWAGTVENVQVVEPMVGGTGARCGADGIDGRDSGISNLANNPVETVESEICVRVLRYKVRADSGGPGQWRGGCGLVLTFEALRACSLLARGLERQTFRPWGYAGGQPGWRTELVINQGTDRELRPTVVDVIDLAAGDAVTLLTAGAGGYGDPYERDPAAVIDDVWRGMVSRQGAARDYGVILTVDDELDVEATKLSRLQLPERMTGVGPERERWNLVFDEDLHDTMIEKLFAADIVDRNDRKQRLMLSVLDMLPDGFPRTSTDPDALRAAAHRFSVLVAAMDLAEAAT